jgi:hypothetical protein
MDSGLAASRRPGMTLDMIRNSKIAERVGGIYPKRNSPSDRSRGDRLSADIEPARRNSETVLAAGPGFDVETKPLNR